MIDANDLLDVESELGRIVKELEVSKDTGDVIIAICNDFSLRKLITDEIIGRTGYNRYDIHLDEKNKNLPKILFEEKDEILDSIVFVHGIEKAEPEIYRYLNFQRDIFYKLKQRVVLWCYSGFVRNLIKYAADFWRFKGNTYEFDLKAEIEFPVVQYMLSKDIYYRDIDELNSRIKIFEYLLKEVKSDKEKADMLLKIGMFYYLKGEYDTALERYNQSLEIAKSLGDQLKIAYALHNIAIIHESRGGHGVALDLYKQSLEIAKSLGNQHGITYTLHGIATIYQHKGEYDVALDLYKQSLEIAKSLGDQRGITYALDSIATIHRYKGEYDVALDLCNQSLKIAKSLGDQRGITLTTAQIGILLLTTKRYKEALQNFMASAAISEKLDLLDLKIALNDIINTIKQELGEEQFNQYQKEIESLSIA